MHRATVTRWPALRRTSKATARAVTADGERKMHARYLVGSDGGRSVVRKTLGIEFPGESLKARAVMVALSLSGLTR